MKKLVLMLVVVIATAISSVAQTSQIATLSHDGSISTYYSSTALKDAYEAAEDGDVITLSAGTFVGCNIAKYLTIRGAGMDPDNNPTVVTGSLTISCTATDNGNTLTMEGLFFNETLTVSTGDYYRLIKCRVRNLYITSCENIMALHCQFNNAYFGSSLSSGYTYTFDFTNCIVNNHCGNSRPESGTFTNCILYFIAYNSSSWSYTISNCYATLKNCILIDQNGHSNGSSHVLSSSAVATYCYYLGHPVNPFQNMLSTTNVILSSDTEVFKDEVDFELTDGNDTVWVGEDGTQVGIYGGSMPFDRTTSNPQITKFNVASKTTADGKLSVDIEVNAN